MFKRFFSILALSFVFLSAGTAQTPDTALLKKNRYPEFCRMGVVRKLDEKQIAGYKKICLNKLRFFYSDEKELAALKPSLKAAAENNFKFTLEYVPENWDKAKTDLPDMLRKAVETAAPWEKNVIGYGIAAGEHVPACSGFLNELLPEARKIVPDKHLIVQPVPNAADYASLVPLCDAKLIYTAPLKSEKDAPVVEKFLQKNPVTFLTDRVNSPWLSEANGFCWSMDGKEILNFPRPLHKQGSLAHQDESIIQAVKKVSRPDSLRFLFVTDIHFIANLPDSENQPQYGHLQRMADIAKQLKLDYFANGGDTIDGHCGCDAELPMLKRGMSIMQSSGLPVFTIIGNHDEGSWTSEERNDFAGRQMVRPETWFQIVCEPALKAGAVGDPDYPYAKYFYYDHPVSKIRTIFLATNANPLLFKDGKLVFVHYFDLTGNQVQWLAKKAFDFSDKKNPSEWSVLLIGHMEMQESFCENTFMPLLKALRTGGKAKAAVKYPIPGKYDVDYSKQGPIRVLGQICGHRHNDFVTYHDGNIPVVTCAQERPNKGLPPRELWGIFVLNPSENKLYMFRHGGGIDLEIDLPR